ncbi:MAG: hypothetical protein ACTHJY_18320, partial [Rhizobiaceae bacterium]
MTIRPIHHGRNGYSMLLRFMHFFVMYQRSRVALFSHFLRHFSTHFATLLRLSAHGAHTTLPSYTKLPSGSWRVQIRHKGRYVNETFLRRDDARR